MPVSRAKKVKESEKTNERRPAKKDFIDCVIRRFQIQHYCQSQVGIIIFK